MAEDTALSMAERTELERLRAEVTTLRSQVQGQGPGGKAGRPAAVGGRQRWRSIVATLLIVVGCVLAPLSVAAIWTRNQVTNTERYVATVTPLASDPAIQNAIADQITAQVFTYIDVQGLTNQAVDALAERGLNPTLETAAPRPGGADRQRGPELHPQPGRQGGRERRLRRRLGPGQPGRPTKRWSGPSPARATGR